MRHIPPVRFSQRAILNYETRRLRRRFAGTEHAIGRQLHGWRRWRSPFLAGIAWIAIFVAVSSAVAYGPSMPDWFKPAPQVVGAGVVTGPAAVIDGDTVVVSGTTVRLKGVDAAELGTARGENARRVMAAIVTGSLTCRLTGEKTWGREVGYCATAAGTDINREIIARGAALSCPRYDDRYRAFERPEALSAQPRSPYCVPGGGATTGSPSIRPSPQVIGPPSLGSSPSREAGRPFATVLKRARQGRRPCTEASPAMPCISTGIGTGSRASRTRGERPDHHRG